MIQSLAQYKYILLPFEVWDLIAFLHSAITWPHSDMRANTLTEISFLFSLSNKKCLILFRSYMTATESDRLGSRIKLNNSSYTLFSINEISVHK